jgi:hypothetical protein
MNPLNQTPAERYAQLIASGFTSEEALAQLLSHARPGEKTKGRAASAGLLPWSSSAGGDTHAADRVDQNLVRSEFERKCAEQNIPPEVYNGWPPCVELDRFSVVDARKANQESGLVQANLNIDQMIIDKHQPIRTVSEFATSAFDMETDRHLIEELLADVAAGKYPYLRLYIRRPDRLTRRIDFATTLYTMLLTRSAQMDVDIIFTGVKGAPTSTFVESFLNFWLDKFVEAEQASLVTRDRILDKTEPRSRDGEVMTGAYKRAFGYTEGEDGSIILTPEAAWMDEAIIRIALEDETPYFVWSDLCVRGMIGRPKKSGGEIIPAGAIRFQSWLRMLASPRWCAHRWFKADRDKRDDRTYKGILIPLDIPGVCSRQVWEHELLPKLNKGKGVRNGEARIEHELTRIGYCPCGSHLICSGDYYVCAAKVYAATNPDLAAEIAGQSHVTIPTAVFEAASAAVMFASLDAPVLAETGAEQRGGQVASELDRERAQLTTDLATIALQLKRHDIKIDSGSYDDDPSGAKADGDELKLARHEKSARLAQLAREEKPAELLDSAEVRALWVNASAKAMQKVFGTVFEKIVVAPTRRGPYVRHEERLSFVFKGDYVAPADELAALLARLADERIAALRLARQAEGQSAFTARAVELHESDKLPNQQIAERLIKEFEISPRGCLITSTLVWDVLDRYYKRQGKPFVAHHVARHQVSTAAQQRLYQLRSGGHIWREVAELMNLAAVKDTKLAHPKGPWTSQSARTAFYSYVQFGGAKPLDEGRARLGRMSDDLLSRLNRMQKAGMSYQKLADHVTAKGNYISVRGNTVCNPGTVFTQLRNYRIRIEPNPDALDT